jgi:hypothetical protein
MESTQLVAAPDEPWNLAGHYFLHSLVFGLFWLFAMISTASGASMRSIPWLLHRLSVLVNKIIINGLFDLPRKTY